ncbi:hypothetical protein [Terrabacter sp. NPDC000476]|uniref:hypothetical protein n=1 Tax=Terrabacter sp. NPDC000476 TaxID=3154258 RepID=UPI00332761B7
MTTIAPPVTGSARPRHLGALTAAAALLVAAVALAPFPLALALSAGRYPDLAALRVGVADGFVQLWADGDGRLGELSAAADFWARFHLVKATLASALLVALCILLARVWRASAVAVTRGRRWSLAGLGLGATGLAVVALLVVVANLQGALAPLSSVLGVLSFADPGGPLLPVVEQARQAVGSGAMTPAAEVLRADFVRYHAVMAMLGSAVTSGLVVGAVMLWRRRRRTALDERSWRRVLAAGTTGSLLLASAFGVVTAANASTALHPAVALLGFLAGGA